MTTPKSLNIGSGRFFFTDCLNVDIDGQWTPDILLDLSRKDLFAQGPVTVPTERFGDVVLEEGCMDHILAWHILEHIPDLIPMMTHLLFLLREEGTLHVRAFNENSWLYYTDWFWYLNWKTHRFVVTDLRYVPSPYGEKLMRKKPPMDALLRVPRAIDEIDVTLKKILLSREERETEFQKVHRMSFTEHYRR